MTDMPWTAFLAPGVRRDIETASYRTTSDLITAVANTCGRAPAFTACLPDGVKGALGSWRRRRCTPCPWSSSRQW